MPQREAEPKQGKQDRGRQGDEKPKYVKERGSSQEGRNNKYIKTENRKTKDAEPSERKGTESLERQERKAKGTESLERRERKAKGTESLERREQKGKGTESLERQERKAKGTESLERRERKAKGTESLERQERKAKGTESLERQERKAKGTRSLERQGQRGKGTGPRERKGKAAGTKALCPVAAKCGGCQWIDKSYEEQLQAKSVRFRKLMEPYCRPEAIIGMENPANYRNKVHAAFGEDRRHNAISGIYEERSHRIVPVDSCLIENQKADEIIVSVRGLLKSFKIRPYNEDTGFGLLRHVLIRVGHATGEIMVVLVLSSPIMPSKNHFVEALLKLHPEITTIVVNVNDRDTSMILGERQQVIYGKGYIEDRLCGMVFRISPKSFYQVNPVQTEKLYARAMEYAGLTGRETVLDAYCGTGTIGMIAAGSAARVLGVELNQDAIRDAVSNAKRNQIGNIRFYQNDAGRFLLEMAEAKASLDVLLMDPPRSGSSEEFLNAAVKIRPGRIVYISCNPETLVRDLKYLTKKGYEVGKCVAVDMFPFTDAVEAVCLLNNRKPDTKVRTVADLEGYYRIRDAKKNQD